MYPEFGWVMKLKYTFILRQKMYSFEGLQAAGVETLQGLFGVFFFPNYLQE